ncbi:MAG: DUF6550 family protein [Oscillospiraceae bacterium]
MKEKTKKMLIISGSAAVCAALVCVISAQFAKEEQPIETASLPQQNTPAVTVAISTTEKPETEPAVIEESEEIYTAEPPAETLELPENVQEIDQSFSEPELPEPEPPVPVITEEAALTNPDQPPEYEPAQTAPAATTAPNNTPQHGDKQNGMIYINGFGWVADEGGGGVCEYADNMYENGNKIGYFG